MRITVSLLFLCSLLMLQSPVLRAQENAEISETTNDFHQTEDSLNYLAENMFTSIMPNGKMEAGMAFAKLLFKTLREPASYQYPFDSLGKKIHILTPDDKSFRIFNWLVAPDEGITRYYAIIQTKDTVYPLTNFSDRLIESKTLLSDTLDRKHWFGAEYYKMISRKVERKKYYFIMGLNTDGNYSNKKIIDVLSFNEDGPVFGAPLFVFPSESGTLQVQSRVVWQYKKEASFYLDFDKEHDFITFDDLRSQINNPLRKNTFVPTGRIDGLKWDKGRWIFVENIITPMQLKDGQAPVNGVIQK